MWVGFSIEFQDDMSTPLLPIKGRAGVAKCSEVHLVYIPREWNQRIR